MECYIEFGEKNDILILIFLFVDINVGMAIYYLSQWN